MSIVKQSLVGASGQGGGYTIDDSLRFRSSASAYLNRTPASAGNRKTWTLSWWAKRGALGSTGFTVFSAGTSASDTGELVIKYDNNYPDSLAIQTGSTNIRFTNALYRDPSAWHHVVVAFDTTQATAANRHKVYVNGEEITSFNLSNNLAQNTDTAVNNNVTQEIGVFARLNAQYFDGYLTEVQMIDGQQLTADDFGEFDDNGTWKAKEYTGTYGTNGFYLPFRNPTGSSVSADYLVIAGGGGGNNAGGGGAGGYLTGTGLSLNSGTNYAVTVGAGGTSGVAGSDSVFNSITSDGGGEASAVTVAGGNGGSGGGGTGAVGGTATVGQGNDGGDSAAVAWSGAGGGGGAGAAGANGSNTGASPSRVDGAGGAGLSSSITGSAVTRAGGGGGGSSTYGTAGAGGAGGGGAGTTGASTTGGAGTVNTGGGGGGGRPGGAGGSGVVIISYSGAQVFSGGTITSSGGNTIHTFTTSGILTTVFNDFSGNDNNWTGNNFNVSDSTATTYDLMKDTPSLVDENAGNFCTWNPLRPNAAMSYANGNLSATSSGGSGRSGYGTFGMPSGKWYFETTGGDNSVGVATIEGTPYAIYTATGTYSINGTTTSGKATYTTSDIIGCAYDADGGNIEFFKNGVSQGSSSFTAGLGLYIVAQFNGTFNVSRTCVANFGQRPFAYTPPTGFLKLNTFNLPDSTIEKGSDYFNTVLYNGNGGAHSITGVNFQPDTVWVKRRNGANNHNLFDAVRGTNALLPNATNSELNRFFSSYDSDGFSFAAGGHADNNASGGTYVAWNWLASNTTASNTVGTIPSTVSANTTAGFSIVSYTGTGSAATVGHGLGAAPDMLIVKNRSGVYQWIIQHASLGATKYLTFTTDAEATSSAPWNNTAPTSTVFSLGTSSLSNRNANNFIAYCFAPVEGYSAFGSYTGNGSTDGPFVYTGFRPAFVMVKVTAGAIYDANWFMLDSARGTYNVNKPFLAANNANAENSGATCADFLSNGFKLRITNSLNDSNATYIYMAFAENPFKNANAR